MGRISTRSAATSVRPGATAISRWRMPSSAQAAWRSVVAVGEGSLGDQQGVDVAVGDDLGDVAWCAPGSGCRCASRSSPSWAVTQPMME